MFICMHVVRLWHRHIFIYSGIECLSNEYLSVCLDVRPSDDYWVLVQDQDRLHEELTTEVQFNIKYQNYKYTIQMYIYKLTT